MLKLNDDNSITIGLVGRETPDLVFVLTGLLGVLALGVAYLVITQPTVIAIGGMFGLAVSCFFFNNYKEKIKNKPITSGNLTIRPFEISFYQTTVVLSDAASVEIANHLLIVQDKNKVWQFGGFESEKELQIAQKVLQGQAIGGRGVQIKMR